LYGDVEQKGTRKFNIGDGGAERSMSKKQGRREKNPTLECRRMLGKERYG